MMNQERAVELQRQLTREAVSLMSLFGEAAEIQRYKQAISLTGKAWGVPQASTDEQLGLIQREQEIVCNGKDAADVLPAEELRPWSGTETFEAIEDLFETSLHLNDFDERRVMFEMAEELREVENFLDWIEKSKKERQELKAG